jgi:hypothetical protein
MNDFIFTIDHNKQDTTDYKFYCLVGDEDHVDSSGNPMLNTDSNKVLAKKITKTNNPTQYFIRLSTNNKLYNPISQLGEDKSSSIVDNTCRPTNRFTPVSYAVFECYLQVLCSKNLLWLNKAEREKI